ncbi:hypothetical protein J1614_006429, partial [Plenodomus biglobosus]
MPPRPFVNDGLWRCLCPGFPLNATPSSVVLRAGAAPRRLRKRAGGGSSSSSNSLLTTVINTIPSSTPSSIPSTTSTTRTPLGHGQSRAYNTNTYAPFNPNDPFAIAPAHKDTPSPPTPAPAIRAHNNTIRNHAALARLSTPALYEAARTAGAKGSFNEVMDICRVLIGERGEARNTAMYTAVLHSFVNSWNGTGGKVRKVLEEMGFWEHADGFTSSQARIELDTRACECVLEALAVHPDYLLRNDILDYMKTRWLPLSDRARNFVIAGMLRERHFEHALELLEDMVKAKAHVESWLFAKAMWMLLEFGEAKEAFYVLSLKQAAHSATLHRQGSVKLTGALWGALLDAAAREQLHEHASKIWLEQVQTGYLKPGTGACFSLLTLAARHGDVRLATDVFRLLTERETSLTALHYELLIATYLKAHDISSALSVLLIMVDASLKVDEGTCNPLFLYLSSEKPGEESRPMQAFHLLQNYEAVGRKIPTAAVNACIQASIHLSRFEEALEIYKSLHRVSHAGPNTQTFNNLFRGCYLTGRKELAMFLAEEMFKLNLKPDRVTYDRLIIVCMKVDDLDDAILYYEEMTNFGVESGNKNDRPRRRTWELLITKCVQKGDERAVALFEAYKKEVDNPRRDLEKAVKAVFQSGTLPLSDEGANPFRELEMPAAGDEKASEGGSAGAVRW